MDLDTSLSDDRAVLSRAAKLLQAFSGAHRILTLNELTLASGLPKSTTHRLIGQLVDLGWLERDVEGYRIGMQLFKAGRLADRRVRLRRVGLPHLQELADATGLATSVGVFAQGHVLCLEVVPGRRFRLPVPHGARLPASCTALGKSLLAHVSPAELDAVLDGPLPNRTSRSIIDPARLAGQLVGIRDCGVARAEGEMFDGVDCLATSVCDEDGALASIAVSGPIGQLHSSGAETALRAAARQMASEFLRSRARAGIGASR